MNATMKAILSVVGIFILMVVVVFGLRTLGMVSWSFFGKWGEEIRYDIHKESQTYRDGMQRNLSQLKLQWDAAEGAGRTGIEAAVKQQYSQTDTSEYPAYLQDFLRQVGIY